MRKWFVIFAVLGSIGWIVWASFWAVPSDRNVVTVTRNIGGRKGFRKHWEAWVKAFERDNPGWKMELVDLGDQNGAEYYKKCIATGDLPDVLMTWLLVRELADGGHLVPLPKGYYERYGIPTPDKINGQWYTTQGGLQLLGIAVNKRMWADIGITEPPRTWDAFLEGLRKLKAAGHRPLAFGGREWSAGIPFSIWMALEMYNPSRLPGGESWTVARKKGEVSFVTDATARMILRNLIGFLDEFAETGVASVGYNDEQRTFYGGQAATWIMGCWISGGLEPAEVAFDIDYWPFPSMTDRPPRFIAGTSLQSGWAVSTSAVGARLSKAQAVLHAYYDPEVLQEFLNAEGQFALATNVPVRGPVSDWPATQTFYDSMARRYKAFGYVPGLFTTIDMPDPAWDEAPMRMTQEILAGTRDIDKLLRMLDDAWDAAHNQR